MKWLSIDEILAVMKRKVYKVFTDDSKDFNLNIIGIRANSAMPNQFDDRLIIFWRYGGRLHYYHYAITTDPGLYWLLNPMRVEGTAILKPGQYRGLWAIGLHRGVYEALTQVRPCTVIRDRNRDAKLDFDAPNTQTGLFGINLHRAANVGETRTIDRWSAGCQVFAHVRDFESFMKIARKAASNWGNSFTYTLLQESDFV